MTTEPSGGKEGVRDEREKKQGRKDKAQSSRKSDSDPGKDGALHTPLMGVCFFLHSPLFFPHMLSAPCFKAAIIYIFMLTMHHLTTCM